MNKKHILVIGGAGYIGSHVVLAFLEADYHVTVLDNLSSGQRINLFSEAEFIHGDIQDRLLLHNIFSTDKKYSAVVHLAAAKAANESMIVPEKYSKANLINTLNIIEAMATTGTNNLIFSSSAAVYGEPEYLPIDEEHALDPINFYGFTKLEIERTLAWFDKLKNLKSASLRYFNAAGYDPLKRIKGLENNPANLIPIVMETVVGVRSKIEVFGDDYDTEDGSCYRDYIHVTDIAKAHVDAFRYLEKEKTSLSVNLGTGNSHSVLEVIETAEQVTQKPINKKIGPRREGDPANLYASSEKALKLLGWKSKYSDLKTIIESTWEIYKHS